MTGTVLAWLIALVIFGPILLAGVRVVYAAWLWVYHSFDPRNMDAPFWRRDERPMTVEEYHQQQLETAYLERQAEDLRRMEIEQESWT